MLDSSLKILYVIGFVVGLVIRAVYTAGTRKTRIADDQETVLGKLLMTLSSLGLIILPFFYLLSSRLDFADYHLPAWAALTAGIPGVAIFAFALWLLWRSHVDLGRNWLPMLQIREGHTLITQGVYSHIRHPMYAAHLVWGIAQALLLQNWIAGLSMLVFFFPVYLFRAPREERILIEHFGQEYRSYMNRTGRLIPITNRSSER
ncbi:protein-S-isoprenylcysteine O-methyltransferase [Candidatus Poribacteria bacterium]